MQTASWIIVVAFTAIALGFDLRTRRIPNWLTVTAFALGVLFHLLTSGFAGLGTALAGFAVGFGILFVLWLIGGGGGGDVKLMGALGAWLGPWLTMVVFLGSGVFALIGIVVLFTWRVIARGTSATQSDDGNASAKSKSQEMDAARRMIPYAVPVALATWTIAAMKLLVILAQTRA